MDNYASVFKRDGWQNFAVGLGGKMDKRQHTTPGSFQRLNDAELADAYLSDGFARNVVDMPADDMTRAWVTVENDPEEVIINKLSDLRAQSAFNEALKWARLFRGSFIFIGAMDGRKPDEPLVVKPDTKFSWLYVGDATMVQLAKCIVNNDPQSPMFNQIEKYSIDFPSTAGSGAQINRMIHASRILPFYGDPAPRKSTTGVDVEIRQWGISALQSTWDRLADYGGITSGIANLMYEFANKVLKFKGLGQILSQKDGEGSLMDRLEAINLSMSIIHAIVMDEGEEVTWNTVSLAGIPEILDRFSLALSGVARIPATRLYGRSPAGLNATGESDMQAYYDSIEAKQKNDLQPQLQTLVDMLAISEKVPDTDHQVVFEPLYQREPKVVAETEKLEAEKFKTLVDALTSLVTNGVIDGPRFESMVKELAKERYPEISEQLAGGE